MAAMTKSRQLSSPKLTDISAYLTSSYFPFSVVLEQEAEGVRHVTPSDKNT